MSLAVREPTYLVLDENEDFSMNVNVDVAGDQRIAVTGYLQRTKPDGLYVTPLIPELFFGADGQQLQTWLQNLHVGEQVVLSRSGGNPRVPDNELLWTKSVSNQPPVPIPIKAPITVMRVEPAVQSTVLAIEPFPLMYIVVPIAIIAGLVIIYKLVK